MVQLLEQLTLATALGRKLWRLSLLSLPLDLAIVSYSVPNNKQELLFFLVGAVVIATVGTIGTGTINLFDKASKAVNNARDSKFGKALLLITVVALGALELFARDFKGNSTALLFWGVLIAVGTTKFILEQKKEEASPIKSERLAEIRRNLLSFLFVAPPVAARAIGIIGALLSEGELLNYSPYGITSLIYLLALKPISQGSFEKSIFLVYRNEAKMAETRFKELSAKKTGIGTLKTNVTGASRNYGYRTKDAATKRHNERGENTSLEKKGR